MDEPLKILASMRREHGRDNPETWLFYLLKMLEKSESVSYILDGQLRFMYCNPAWDRFATSNDALALSGESVVGTTLMTSVPDVLTGVYEQAFQSVRETGRVWSKSYQCSSPGQFRQYRMRIHPLKRLDWFLVSNALVVSSQHERVCTASQEMYFNDGVITMCAHCRCSRRFGPPEQWDFVPEYLQFKGWDLLKVSHGLCPTCQAYFYPDL
jgi:hypothetical protein